MSTSNLPWQQRPDAEDPVCIPPHSQHGNRSHQDFQWFAVCSGWWTDVWPLSTGPDSCFWHCGPHFAVRLTLVSVQFAWQRSQMVPVISVRENMAAVHRVQLTFFVLSRNDRCLVRSCLFCTLPTSPTKSTNMESTFMRTLMIYSYMYTVIAATQLQLLHYLDTALPTSVTGCPLIDWSSTQTKLICCGPVQNTVCHYLMVTVQVCVLEKILSLPTSTSVFLVSPSRLTSVWINMSAMFVQQDFSGFDTPIVFEGHLILTWLRHSFMPLCHPAWINAMQSLPGRRRM